MSGHLSSIAGSGHPSPMQLWLAFTIAEVGVACLLGYLDFR
ncbi:hypothetical protein WMF04_05045 [Sorangium sp. So ce260]